jgi:hypothetical protein
MMDTPVIEIAAPAAREVLRDPRGSIIGTLKPQRLTGKLVARDGRGFLAGTYDSRLKETRDARGRVVGRAKLLGALLLRGR